MKNMRICDTSCIFVVLLKSLSTKVIRKNYLSGLLLLQLVIGNGVTAEPITYSFEGQGTGVLGGTSFENENISFSLFADTDAVYVEPLSEGIFYNDVTYSEINVTGFSIASFTTPGLRVFMNTSMYGLGFMDARHYDLLDIIDVALSGYDLTTAIGVIHEPDPFAFFQFRDVSTTLGAMTLTDVDWVNFEAIVNEDSSAKPYVVFLPGLLGSRLWGTQYGKEAKLWPTGFDNYFYSLRPNEQGEVGLDVYTKPLNSSDEGNSGVISTIGSLEPIFDGFTTVYGDFLGFLNQLRDENMIAGWEAVPYDWRKSVEDIADTDDTNLERGIYICDDEKGVCNPYFSVVERIIELKNQGVGPVVLVGHSNGGLFAKAIMRELESLPDIGPDNVRSYVDRVILVASPQLGTPKSLLTLLHGEFIPDVIQPAVEREVAETTIGAYTLLPSSAFFALEQLSLVEFSPEVLEILNYNELLVTLLDKYGETIDTNDRAAFEAFLKAELDGRQEPYPGEWGGFGGLSGGISTPNVLRSPLLSKANDLHSNLDTWNAPAGVEVIQIVGVGKPSTPRGVRYYPRRLGIQLAKLGHETLLSVDNPGDGTVLPSSAGALDVPTYHVELTTKCYDGENRGHMDILGSQKVQEIIKSVLEKSEYLGHGCVNSTPIPPKSVPARRLTVLSPATLHIYDEEGRHTGVISSVDAKYPLDEVVEEKIPNSSWDLIDGHETIVIEANYAYRARIEGTGSGVVTLISEEIYAKGTQSKVIYANVPVSHTTTGEIWLPAVGGSGDLEVDFNSDGTIDSVVSPATKYDPIMSLYALADFVRTLRLPKGTTQSLISKVQDSIAALEMGNPDAARDSLRAFVNFVNAQLGKKIAADIASGLKQITSQIQASI